VIEDCLLRGGQLEDLHHPVDFHHEQCASAHDRILGRLENCRTGPTFWSKVAGDASTLGLDKAAVCDVHGGQERLPRSRESWNPKY
jgi:hypothetical protein